MKKFARIQADVDLARVACALERYRLAHGSYPETLDALAPQFIEKLPHDLSTANRFITGVRRMRLRKAPMRPVTNLSSTPSAGMKKTMAAWSALTKNGRTDSRKRRLGMEVLNPE